jgi:hypothetical protein
MLTFQSPSALDEEAPRSAAHTLSRRGAMGGHDGSLEDAEEFAVETLRKWGVGEEDIARIGPAVRYLVKYAVEQGLEPVHAYLRLTRRHLIIQVEDASDTMPRRKGNKLQDNDLENALEKLRSATSQWYWGARRQQDAGKVIWIDMNLPLRWTKP